MTDWLFLVPSSGAEWRDWLGDEGPRLLSIIVVVAAVRLLARPVVSRLLRSASSRARRLRPEDELLIDRRIKTIESTITWAVTLTVGFVGLAAALDLLGLDATALIAGVGVAGIALGLGAQTLIKDVVNGVFILIEDQYGIGDVVRVADTTGLVVDITPRRTVLRDLDGNLHSIPNSEVRVATNMTREFSRINLDVSVAYEEDLARVIAAIDDECRLVFEERTDEFVTQPKVLRVNSLGESGIDIKITADVRPGKQWELMGALRLRLKARFARDGISIPYPHQVQVPYRDSPPELPS